MCLLVHKSAQNNSIKGEFEGSLHVKLKGVPEIFFREHLKRNKKVKTTKHLTL